MINVNRDINKPVWEVPNSLEGQAKRVSVSDGEGGLGT